MGSQTRSARRRSLRLRLLVLMLVPLLSLAGLWTFVAFVTTRATVAKHDLSAVYEKAAGPATSLAAAVQGERLATAIDMASHGAHGHSDVVSDRSATDSAEAAFRDAVLKPAVRAAMDETTRGRLDDLTTRLDGLTEVRAHADARQITNLDAIDSYDTILDSLIHVLGGMVVVDDRDIYRQGAAILDVSAANELMRREDALVNAALARPAHRMTIGEHALFVRSADNERYLFTRGRGDMGSAVSAPVDRMAGAAAFEAFHGLEDAIAARGARASLVPRAEAWRTTVTPLTKSWPEATAAAGTVLSAQAGPTGDSTMLLLYIAGAIGLVAVAVSVAVSLLLGRSLARELSGLQEAALDLAGERLPSVIRRLRGGQQVDVEAEVPRLDVGQSTEVRKVAEALTTLHRTAVEAAVGEARLRQGINQVFLNLAWRSQSLLHRQLTMLDAMERQATDPDALEDLFALDHLTTRMRRHAEGLVILSGAAPARGWHHPVVIRDVLRGAIAEVEDYTRVDVQSVSPAALVGGVVADITHLLAELIENATAFSPPGSQVLVRGELMPNGYLVEVEDRGIGMDPDELDEANGRLARPPEFDLADSDRLGLFIVGRLAARHRIIVVLEPSPYGGVKAAVLLPLDVIVRDNGSGDAWAEGNAAAQEVPGPPDVPRYITAPRQVVTVPEAPGSAGWNTGGFTEELAGELAGEASPQLPRRVRQTNLVPQLRQDGPPETVGSDPSTTRAPEEVRSLMSSLQQGWQRGRQDDDDLDDL